MIVLVAEWTAKPGRGDEIAETLREVIPIMHDEPGVLLYHPNRSVDDPDRFLLYEHYPDQPTREAHRDTAHFKEYIEGRIWPLLTERRVTIYDLVTP
jgi:(4S)-4-hydroxy-5-phosphonooxypentane-2,3-dione isomerase